VGTGLVIVMLLAVLVGAYSLQLRHLHRVAADNLQRALRSEQVFAESFHASPIPLALMSLETHRITEVNDAYVQMLGWSREELLTRTADQLAIQNGNELITRARRLRRNGVLRDYTSSLRCKDGSTREALISMDMIAIDNVPHSLTTIIDQTEHRHALAELQSTDQRLRELAENVDEVFWVSSPDRSQMHYVSPAYAKIWGRSVESLYAEPASWLEAVVPEDRARLSLERQQREYRIRRPDGTLRWIRAKSFPVRDGSGEVIRLAGVVRDVTEQRSLEDQLRQAQKMESLGMLAGGIAHDFNNLLAVISSCGGLLAESLGRTHPDAELVDDIADAVVRASQLTRQLLAFSRKQVTEPVVLDPNCIVTDTRKLVRRMVGVNVEVVTSLEPELRPVMMDRGHLVQVILNLAVNARDAMPGRGTLRLTTRNVGNNVVLEVTDNGSGMPPEVRARACEPFFTTKELGKGTGMGLAVVHGIVDGAGGRIEIDSEPGSGTTFRILLPAFDGPVQTLRPVSDASVRGVETILIVDDDEYVRRATARALRSRGYTVIEAGNGRAALVVLPTVRFDLLLTDIVMPGMSGRVLAEAAQARFPDLKVLMMTGYTDDDVVHSGVASGQVDLIEKPFTIAALATKVRAVLDVEPALLPDELGPPATLALN
jgi:PAS domain S-box-containing protein